MSENSKIEWCDHTINFWWGCDKVHEGCANCYAEAWSKRWGKKLWGPGSVRLKMSGAIPEAMKLNRRAAKEGRKYLVFSNSMSDWFEDFDGDVVDQEGNVLGQGLDCLRSEAAQVVDDTPNLIWLVLTKRPENARRMLPAKFVKGTPQPIFPGMPGPLGEPMQTYHIVARDNLWIGTSVSLQEHVDKQVPALHGCSDLCAGLFLSIEPLLGRLDLEYPEAIYGPDGPETCCSGFECGCRGLPIDPPLIHGIGWTIVGGESGHKARPMHPDAVRSLREQCNSWKVPFFFKQWGEWLPASQIQPNQFGEANHWSVDRVKLDDDRLANRVGKKSAGRLLDGREWNEFPAAFGREVAHA